MCRLAAHSKIAAVKPAAAASAVTPRTQRDSRTAMRAMVLQSAALIARDKGVVSRLHPSLKSYKATFTLLYDSLNELLAQLLFYLFIFRALPKGGNLTNSIKQKNTQGL